MESVVEILGRALSLELVLLVVGLVGLLYWYGTSNKRLMSKLNVPGPKPRMFVGSLPEVKNHGGMHLMIYNYVREYGKVFAICIGRKPSLVVSDPEILKQIMIKNFANFRNRFFPTRPQPPLSRSVFAAENDDWKRVRTILTPTFSAAKMKQMLPLIEESCDTLMKKLDEVADTGKSVNLLDYFGQLTLEVILSAAFGVKENIQQSPDNQILLKAKGVFRIPSFVRALNRLPFGGVILRILLWFRGNSNFLVNIASSIIADRRRGSKSARKDLMQLMLTAHGDKTVQGIPKLTDDEIVAQSVIFLLAGYETSSNTLAVTAHNLAIHPEVQEKLRQDIKNVFDNSPDADLYDVVQNLDYLDCVINESLRLFPPAFQMNRKCLEACDINGVHFPAGIEVIIPFYSIHRDPVAWPEPEKFDPERFRSPAKESRHPLHFMPFGSGPRTCIGMRFAQMEVKTTLVGILRKYRLVRCPETQHPLPMLAGATLTPRDGVFVRVEKLR